MRVLLVAAAMLLPVLAPGRTLAQPRAFSCVGAERLEDDVFAVPFAQGSTTLNEAGRSAVAAAAALAREDPTRNLCVLGHADRTAGATTSTQTAAQRARAVAAALSSIQRVERDRIRAEARVGAYSGRQREPLARAVTIVVMP